MNYLYEPEEASGASKCHHCGFYHEPPVDSCRIPDAPLYVTSYDPFFSNDEQINIVVVDAQTEDEADRIIAYIRSRADQKNIRMRTRDEMGEMLRSYQSSSGRRRVFSYLGAWKEHMPPVVPDGAEFMTFRWPGNSVVLEEYNTDNSWYAGGNGYDRKGTCLAQYLVAKHTPELRKLARLASHRKQKTPDGYAELNNGVDPQKRLYGMYAYYTGKPGKPRLQKVSLDGACGFESMEKIIQVMGYELVRVDSTNDAVITETWAMYKTVKDDAKD